MSIMVGRVIEDVEEFGGDEWGYIRIMTRCTKERCGPNYKNTPRAPRNPHIDRGERALIIGCD